MGLPGMSTLREGFRGDHQKRKPRKYEVEFSYILITEGAAKLTDWVVEYATENERVWWWSRILEAETDEEITFALDIAALGYQEANAINVAGIRLQEKLVKAFLKPKPTKPILTYV
jgi:hypothetical protein